MNKNGVMTPLLRASLQEIARTLVARDRDMPKWRGSSTITADITRALIKAYQDGFKAGASEPTHGTETPALATGPANRQAEAAPQGMEMLLIPPRARNCFESFCRFACDAKYNVDDWVLVRQVMPKSGLAKAAAGVSHDIWWMSNLASRYSLGNHSDLFVRKLIELGLFDVEILADSEVAFLSAFCQLSVAPPTLRPRPKNRTGKPTTDSISGEQADQSTSDLILQIDPIPGCLTCQRNKLPSSFQ